jgi:uncharacterized integral membrane protein
MKKWLKFIFGFITIILVLLFGFLNSTVVVLDFFIISIQISQGLLVILSFLLGLIVAVLFLIPKLYILRYQKKITDKKLTTHNKQMEAVQRVDIISN